METIETDVTSDPIGRDTQFGTYRIAGLPAVDFDEFHRVELPRRLREGKGDEVARDVDGVAPLSLRLTYLSDKSETIGGLYSHPRVEQLIALSREAVVPVPDRIEGILAVIKDSGLKAGTSGFANLPFHSDCGFGACRLTCPCVLVGVQLDAMNAQSSQLLMIPGTHGKSVHNRRKDMKRYPIVALSTSPGDATVHYGCGLHAGPAPTGDAPRRTLYLQHYNERAFDLIGPYQGYNQIMPGYGKGEILNIEEIQQHNASD